MSDPSTSSITATPARTVMPSLFISHGSPDTAIADTKAAAFLRRAASELPRPKAIVVVSAHFEVGGGTAVSSDAMPETVYDFGGFQKELYEMKYKAPGDPALAGAIVASLTAQGFRSQAVGGHGFDHGVWVPLKLMYPDADIPVVAVSVDPNAGPDYHLRLGRALAALGREGVLVIGSGSFTHNLREAFVALRQGIREPEVQGWVTEFVDWMNAHLASGDSAALVDYRAQAPFAERNHPTDEHLLPLYAAMGAAGEHFVATQLHDSNEFGVLSMAMWRFDAAA